mgnify:CR=1 FL=1
MDFRLDFVRWRAISAPTQAKKAFSSACSRPRSNARREVPWQTAPRAAGELYLRVRRAVHGCAPRRGLSGRAGSPMALGAPALSSVPWWLPLPRGQYWARVLAAASCAGTEGGAASTPRIQGRSGDEPPPRGSPLRGSPQDTKRRGRSQSAETLSSPAAVDSLVLGKGRSICDRGNHRDSLQIGEESRSAVRMPGNRKADPDTLEITGFRTDLVTSAIATLEGLFCSLLSPLRTATVFRESRCTLQAGDSFRSKRERG